MLLHKFCFKRLQNDNIHNQTKLFYTNAYIGRLLPQDKPYMLTI